MGLFAMQRYFLYGVSAIERYLLYGVSAIEKYFAIWGVRYSRGICYMGCPL